MVYNNVLNNYPVNTSNCFCEDHVNTPAAPCHYTSIILCVRICLLLVDKYYYSLEANLSSSKKYNNQLIYHISNMLNWK